MVIFTSLTVLPRCEHYRKGLIVCVEELLNREIVATNGESTRFLGLSTLGMSVTTILHSHCIVQLRCVLRRFICLVFVSHNVRCSADPYFCCLNISLFYFFSRHIPFDSFLLSHNSQLPSLCLLFLQVLTEGDLQYVFIHPLYVFPPVTKIISNFIKTLVYIYIYIYIYNFCERNFIS